MHLAHTIHFDESDRNVFARPAESGEWAIPGGFEFSNWTEGELVGKARQAFANGWLGLDSFGRATFVAVARIEPAELEALEHRLAEHFTTYYGAPNDAARAGGRAPRDRLYAGDVRRRRPQHAAGRAAGADRRRPARTVSRHQAGGCGDRPRGRSRHAGLTARAAAAKWRIAGWTTTCSNAAWRSARRRWARNTSRRTLPPLTTSPGPSKRR